MLNKKGVQNIQQIYRLAHFYFSQEVPVGKRLRRILEECKGKIRRQHPVRQQSYRDENFRLHYRMAQKRDRSSAI